VDLLLYPMDFLLSLSYGFTIIIIIQTTRTGPSREAHLRISSTVFNFYVNIMIITQTTRTGPSYFIYIYIYIIKIYIIIL